MEKVIINTAQMSCTCCHDVVKLLDFKKDNERGFSLYKTIQVDVKRNGQRWIYFLIVEGDKFPIIITDNAAREILDNPMYGYTLTHNHWHDRYRDNRT